MENKYRKNFNFSDYQKDRMREMVKMGMYFKDIGLAFGCSGTTISHTIGPKAEKKKVTTPTSQECTKCKEIKLFEEFYLKVGTERHSHCKQCMRGSKEKKYTSMTERHLIAETQNEPALNTIRWTQKEEVPYWMDESVISMDIPHSEIYAHM